MPSPGKAKGRKASKAKRQFTTPGLANTPKRTTTPEPKQLVTPDATPRAGRVTLGPFKKQELVATVEEEGEYEEFKVSAEESDSEDPWNVTGDSQADKELSEAGLVGPWAVKGNPPGFLDSEDEAGLEEVAWSELKNRQKYGTSPYQSRELGEFVLHQSGALVGARHPGDAIILIDEIPGEFDEEEEDKAKIVSLNS